MTTLSQCAEPTSQPKKKKKTKRFRVSHLTIFSLIKAAQKGEYTLTELAEISGLHYATVCEFMKAAHREKLVHICGWEPDSRGRYLIRIYMWAPGKDVKNVKLTGAERQRRSREAKKKRELQAALSLQVNK